MIEIFEISIILYHGDNNSNYKSGTHSTHDEEEQIGYLFEVLAKFNEGAKISSSSNALEDLVWMLLKKEAPWNYDQSGSLEAVWWRRIDLSLMSENGNSVERRDEKDQ